MSDLATDCCKVLSVALKSCQRGCGTLLSARRSLCLNLDTARPATIGSSGCGRATRFDTRAATVSKRLPPPPPEQPLRLRGRADVAVDLPRPLVDVHLLRSRPADRLEHLLGDLEDADVDPGRDVDHLADDLLEVGLDDGLDR